ncbi:MAG: hypothetical protein IPK74_25525 [Deltaproteobacteria bacterium]|nr:hypothetical protein [Deltaproteobacteria bacterium]
MAAVEHHGAAVGEPNVVLAEPVVVVARLGRERWQPQRVGAAGVGAEQEFFEVDHPVAVGIVVLDRVQGVGEPLLDRRTAERGQQRHAELVPRHRVGRGVAQLAGDERAVALGVLGVDLAELLRHGGTRECSARERHGRGAEHQRQAAGARAGVVARAPACVEARAQGASLRARFRLRHRRRVSRASAPGFRSL